VLIADHQVEWVTQADCSSDGDSLTLQQQQYSSSRSSSSR
jgi:hypothetical protein